LAQANAGAWIFIEKSIICKFQIFEYSGDSKAILGRVGIHCIQDNGGAVGSLNAVQLADRYLRGMNRKLANYLHPGP